MLDAVSRQRDFPTLSTMIYLNTAAEGIPPLAVGAAFAQYFRDHQRGMDGRPLHQAQEQRVKDLAGQLLGLSAAEIGLCSCSSEAFNLATQALALREGDEVIINDLEFPSGVTPWLQASCPATVKRWSHRNGALRVEDLAPLLSPRTRALSVSLVSFFNGFKVPLPEVIAAVRQHSPAKIILDVTQALGRIPLDVTGVDLVISSTHKWLLATHGGGIVATPGSGSATRPWVVPAGGWYHLEDAFGEQRFERAVSKPGAAGFGVGMPNYPAIYAVAAALQYLTAIGPAAIARAADPLVHQALAEVRKLPVELITPAEHESLAGIFAFRHPRAAEIHAALHRQNVHVMAHAGRLRVAIHGYNTAEDIERFVRALRQAVASCS